MGNQVHVCFLPQTKEFVQSKKLLGIFLLYVHQTELWWAFFCEDQNKTVFFKNSHCVASKMTCFTCVVSARFGDANKTSTSFTVESENLIYTHGQTAFCVLC